MQNTNITKKKKKKEEEDKVAL